MAVTDAPADRSPDGDPGLADLRDEIDTLDRKLVKLAAERVGLARRIGGRKRDRAMPTVDYGRERKVLDAARERALRSGLDPAVAQDLVARLVRASVTAQEEDNLRRGATEEARSAVVVGGAGRMGRWMSRFLATQGWNVAVLDPNATPVENREAEENLFSTELVLLATPPGTTAELYREWLDGPPEGILVDLASIKTPLLEPIRALRKRGGRVASIHPMFGPSTLLLRGAEVVVCETGDREATEIVTALFSPTTARIVRLPLEDHDRIMADLLSLAHATAIVFALALPDDDHPVHSTTFQALESLAAEVVRESPEVYYEIQAENPHSVEVLHRLRRALERFEDTVAHERRREFVELLAVGRRRTPEPG
ncbi:MAG: prephenate dehydrogenase/arogenate dehydrogenase family protein [Thermoanaerobaculia bacterium]|nr:prephenate dehydrogenase/arogenate dehydrogenase family protein [Thermoanaerobaculia bacterium]